jgi:hypothetical protein
MNVEQRGMLKRRRFRQTVPLKERLESFAREAREKASLLPAGTEKDEMLKKARQAETASHLDAWAGSPGLQTPK